MVFLCGFLPAVLIGYAICPAKYRNFFLFVASLFFYAWGEPRYIVIMLFSTVFDFCNGLLMEYLQHVPREGEEVKLNGYVLRTLQVESHRVQKVLIVPPAHDEDELDYEL